MALTAKQVANRIGVTPQRHGRAIWALSSLKSTAWVEARCGVDGWQEIGEAAQEILHANTGRMSNESALTLREMSAYRAIKVALAVAAVDMRGLIEAERAAVIARIVMEVSK